MALCFVGVTVTSCQTNQSAKESDVFGIYENVTLKTSELTLQEKSALIAAQKQVYETAQRILENHYLDAWFTNYEAKNKLATLEEANSTKQTLIDEKRGEGFTVQPEK